jgi:hypothetical protein
MAEVEMAIKTSENELPVYNEPLKEFTGDIVPEFDKVVVPRLDWFVRARLELERKMLVCGVDPRPESLEFTEAHAAVLLVMLHEFDSPFSARLRPQAAIWAGAYKLKEAAPVLHQIMLDDEDDFVTRLNALNSYVGLVGDEAYEVIDKFLASPNPAIRSAAYRVALEERNSRIAELARVRYETEEDQIVRAEVLRHSALLQEHNSTTATDHP